MISIIRAIQLFGASVVFATAFVATSAAYAEDDFAARTKAARDYIEGKLKVPDYKITYDGPPITVRFSSFVAATVPLWKSYHGAFKRLEESKGKLIVKEYPGGVLHAMTDSYQSSAQRRHRHNPMLHIVSTDSFNLMNGTGNSGLFPDSVVNRVAARVYPKYLKKEYENMGVYLARHPR